MKNLSLLIIGFSLILTHELKAQETKQSVVTIEMNSKNFSAHGVPRHSDFYHFSIQVIDNELNIIEKIFEASKSNPLNALHELRKEIDIWINLGYKIHTFHVMNANNSRNAIYFVLMVKEE